MFSIIQKRNLIQLLYSLRITHLYTIHIFTTVTVFDLLFSPSLILLFLLLLRSFSCFYFDFYYMRSTIDLRCLRFDKCTCYVIVVFAIAVSLTLTHPHVYLSLTMHTTHEYIQPHIIHTHIHTNHHHYYFCCCC